VELWVPKVGQAGFREEIRPEFKDAADKTAGKVQAGSKTA